MSERCPNIVPWYSAEEIAAAPAGPGGNMTVYMMGAKRVCGRPLSWHETKCDQCLLRDAEARDAIKRGEWRAP